MGLMILNEKGDRVWSICRRILIAEDGTTTAEIEKHWKTSPTQYDFQRRICPVLQMKHDKYGCPNEIVISEWVEPEITYHEDPIG